MALSVLKRQGQRKIINEAVDRLRGEESKDEGCLKGHRYLFLKNKNNFTQKQQQNLKCLTISNSKLRSFRALRIKEN
ncbi:transposase [Halosquirtibacter xylanolyticus]|uniref:transposase n=1 Tax=Halosquirtibacter xylanolyticus TaxID=3374599 RepID=UPI00374944A2|nr:transposase [Prolixibacteraceae bacterium]